MYFKLIFPKICSLQRGQPKKQNNPQTHTPPTPRFKKDNFELHLPAVAALRSYPETQLHQCSPNEANFPLLPLDQPAELQWHLKNRRGVCPQGPELNRVSGDADGERELTFSLVVIQVQTEGLEGEWEVSPLPAPACSRAPSPLPPVLKCFELLLCIIKTLPCFIPEMAALSPETSFIRWL